jgi:hypothetical protein
MQYAVLKEWLVPLRQCCQHALKSLSSPSGKNYLAHASKESKISQSVLSILASGLPFPESHSMQLHGVELGQAGDAEQQEREERDAGERVMGLNSTDMKHGSGQTMSFDTVVTRH